MGAGGVGGYVGGRLAQAGETVGFIARGAHLAALRGEGLRIESPLGGLHLAPVEATDDPAAIGRVDVVLFTVKLGDTAAAAARLAPLLGERTRVVTLQNGIDSREMLARHVAAERIVAGCIYISAAISAPGVISSPGGGRRIIVDGLGGDGVVAAFVAACNRTIALEASATDEISSAVWEKFVRLVAFSGITCLTRRPIGAVLEHPETLGFLRQLLEENVAVAAAVGVPFPPDMPEHVLGFYRGLPYETKSSMLHDLDAGKPLEVDWLAGRIVELGRAQGVSTPANAAVMAALAPHARGGPEPNRSRPTGS
jgi:2-dehydropantoate 2-reductase